MPEIKTPPWVAEINREWAESRQDRINDAKAGNDRNWVDDVTSYPGNAWADLKAFVADQRWDGRDDESELRQKILQSELNNIQNYLRSKENNPDQAGRYRSTPSWETLFKKGYLPGQTPE